MIRNGRAKEVFLAAAASANIVIPVLSECKRAGVSEIIRSYTMSQLGKSSEIELGAAVVVLINE